MVFCSHSPSQRIHWAKQLGRRFFSKIITYNMYYSRPFIVFDNWRHQIDMKVEVKGGVKKTGSMRHSLPTCPQSLLLPHTGVQYPSWKLKAFSLSNWLRDAPDWRVESTADGGHETYYTRNLKSKRKYINWIRQQSHPCQISSLPQRWETRLFVSISFQARDGSALFGICSSQGKMSSFLQYLQWNG